eukprot:13554285-Ditylum_brightwellii.AAC.1
MASPSSVDAAARDAVLSILTVDLSGTFVCPPFLTCWVACLGVLADMYTLHFKDSWGRCLGNAVAIPSALVSNRVVVDEQ